MDWSANSFRPNSVSTSSSEVCRLLEVVYLEEDVVCCVSAVAAAAAAAAVVVVVEEEEEEEVVVVVVVVSVHPSSLLRNCEACARVPSLS